MVSVGFGGGAKNEKVDFSVVIPVYRNSESIDTLIESLDKVFGDLGTKNELVFVIDGSPDDSYKEILAKSPMKNSDILLIDLSRNFGSINAVRLGIAKTSGDFIAVLAADLQEPTEVLIDFYQTLVTNEFDIAIGQRISRNDPVTTRFFSSLYWGFYRKTVNPEIPIGGVDIFACTKQVKVALSDLSESGSSLVGLLYWIGFRRTYIKYARRERPFGKSAWTFKKKFRYLSDSIFSFTNAPILLLQIVGLFGISASCLMGVITFTGYVLGRIEQPGYPTLISVILFLSSMILFGLGIVGTYAWRAFENTKNRPLSVLREVHQIPRRK